METARVEKFRDGGREAMIALRTLTLANGRADRAKQILQSFAQKISHDMGLDYYSGRAGQVGTECHSADGPLWYFEAVGQFLRHTGDYAFVRQHVYSVLKRIISWYVRGTHDGIKVDSCGLVSLSKIGVPLTWMNAEVDGRSITPRHGKPVEIQALWYNALCIMEALARRFGDEPAAKCFAGRATVAHWSFNRLFWNAGKQCLCDVVHTGGQDPSVRPNQVFAISLSHQILAYDRAEHVMQAVERDLLTPFGLRTLAPHDAQYRGRCEGDSRQRACAYHQGSVWLWLIIPFGYAYLKTKKFSDAAYEQLSEILTFLQEYLSDGPADQVPPEIFDGDSPHAPRGSTSGGWIAAELQRVLAEASPVGVPSRCV